MGVTDALTAEVSRLREESKPVRACYTTIPFCPREDRVKGWRRRRLQSVGFRSPAQRMARASLSPCIRTALDVVEVPLPCIEVGEISRRDLAATWTAQRGL